MSLNKCMLQGRLTQEPDIRYTTTTNRAVASFSLAVDRDFDREKTDFINCIAWGATAEFVQKWFHKGDAMVAAGRLQTRNYEAKDGSKRYVTEVVCENVYFAGSKHKNEETVRPVNVEPPQFEAISEEEDLPF